MRRAIIVLITVAVAACGGGGSAQTAQAPVEKDDTADVQAAVDKGGTVTFAAKTYHLSRTILIRQSGTVIVGAGASTIFHYQPSQQLQHCVNDRVFTTPCSFDDPPPRQIAASINVGDTSFTAASAGDLTNIQPGTWLLINEYDSVIGDRVAVDWVQVESVAGLQVNVTQPFRMSFSAAIPWVTQEKWARFRASSTCC